MKIDNFYFVVEDITESINFYSKKYAKKHFAADLYYV